MNTRDHHQLADLLAELSASGPAYREFIRVPSMSVGVYRLRPGDVDGQQPHTEDEVYYVVRGRATFVRGPEGLVESQAVSTGSILFVEHGVEHRFIDVVEELVLLVFFAPAEYSAKKPE